MAIYDGGSWYELGGSNSFIANGEINVVASDKYGNIYAAGLFTNSDTNYYIAKYGAAPSGIHEINQSNFIKISPNPSNSLITISSGETLSDATIRLTDLAGQTVMGKDNLSGTSVMLDISALPKGMYFVSVQQGENRWTGKIVKTNK